MANPCYEYWRAVQWILRHLKGIMKCGMVYNGSNDRILILLGILIKKKVSNKLFVHFGRLFCKLKSNIAECGFLPYNWGSIHSCIRSFQGGYFVEGSLYYEPNKWSLQCSMTVKMQYTLVKIRLIMKRQSILIWSCTL